MNMAYFLNRNGVFISLSLLGSIFYIVLLFGLNANPFNSEWLFSWLDSGLAQVGWLFMKNTDLASFPLTYSTQVATPFGLNLAYFDIIPLVAVIFRLISSVLPDNFQYFTIYCFVSFFFQIFFSMKIAELYYVRTKMNLGFGEILTCVLIGLLIGLMPSATWRAVGHFVYAGHGILLAAIYLLLQSQPISFRRDAVLYCIIGFVAGGLNPYYVAMLGVFGFCFAIKSISATDRNYVRVAVFFLSFIAACVLSLIIFGFIDFRPGNDIWPSQYFGIYSANLNSFLNPMKNGSLLLPEMPTYGTGQYEGYNYLGIGVFLMGIFCTLHGIRNWDEANIWGTRTSIFLLLACVLLSVFGLSNKISYFDKLIINISFLEKSSIYSILSNFRSSGRFLWPLSYVIALYFSILAIKKFPQRMLISLLSVAVFLQFFDTNDLRSKVRGWHSGRPPFALTSKVWEVIPLDHAAIVISPAWQCSQSETPGGIENFNVFGRYAALNHLRTNSYYATRMGSTRWTEFCISQPAAIEKGEWDSSAAYVFNKKDLAKMRDIGGATHQCDEVDGFTVCLSKKARTL